MTMFEENLITMQYTLHDEDQSENVKTYRVNAYSYRVRRYLKGSLRKFSRNNQEYSKTVRITFVIILDDRTTK